MTQRRQVPWCSLSNACVRFGVHEGERSEEERRSEEGGRGRKKAKAPSQRVSVCLPKCTQKDEIHASAEPTHACHQHSEGATSSVPVPSFVRVWRLCTFYKHKFAHTYTHIIVCLCVAIMCLCVYVCVCVGVCGCYRPTDGERRDPL